MYFLIFVIINIITIITTKLFTFITIIIIRHRSSKFWYIWSNWIFDQI